MTTSDQEAAHQALRGLPAVDTLLQELPDAIDHWGHPCVVAVVRKVLDDLRQALLNDPSQTIRLDAIKEQVINRLQASDLCALKPVYNLTGTVLHTNLGRAVLPERALDAVKAIARGASNLEFDLESGKRGNRETHVEQLVCELTGAEAATLVNNNAAAVLLVLNTLALGKSVPVSRGELVEIGGSFRIPDVMSRSGCQLVEIGSTNRTHPQDYIDAINDQTAILMKVHTSNYRIDGFTQEVSESALAKIAHDHDLPLVIDLGSGNLVDFAALGLPPEPTAAEALANGADLITFSGDKLLGGPQAGIIAGRADLVAAIKKNPLKRALRLDKMTLVALAEVLKLYRSPETLLAELPTLRMLTRPQTHIAEQAERISQALSKQLGREWEIQGQTCHSQIGSGSLPVETLPSAAITLRHTSGEDRPVRELEQALRTLPKPIIGRLQHRTLWLDVRCLETSQEEDFLAQFEQLSIHNPVS